jgi:hypothetical protein
LSGSVKYRKLGEKVELEAEWEVKAPGDLNGLKTAF